MALPSLEWSHELNINWNDVKPDDSEFTVVPGSLQQLNLSNGETIHTVNATARDRQHTLLLRPGNLSENRIVQLLQTATVVPQLRKALIDANAGSFIP